MNIVLVASKCVSIPCNWDNIAICASRSVSRLDVPEQRPQTLTPTTPRPVRLPSERPVHNDAVTPQPLATAHKETTVKKKNLQKRTQNNSIGLLAILHGSRNPLSSLPLLSRLLFVLLFSPDAKTKWHDKEKEKQYYTTVWFCKKGGFTPRSISGRRRRKVKRICPKSIANVIVARKMQHPQPNLVFCFVPLSPGAPLMNAGKGPGPRMMMLNSQFRHDPEPLKELDTNVT